MNIYILYICVCVTLNIWGGWPQMKCITKVIFKEKIWSSFSKQSCEGWILGYIRTKHHGIDLNQVNSQTFFFYNLFVIHVCIQIVCLLTWLVKRLGLHNIIDNGKTFTSRTFVLSPYSKCCDNVEIEGCWGRLNIQNMCT